ncbi:Rossmann-fold NAD(P)-binding domain-containing protein [Clostridium tagluense]|uniref:hypothetical protein n=1 Tax=Clostridium tagluense TaxID=360422 RepID=UPI001CF4D2F9|nr:hypothetical protein [Clostridium tagluense]MCB2298068.1 hypothetical protein [Clostridium tagluense]
MKPILCVTSDIDNSYNEFGFLSKIKDKRKIKLISNEYIKELDIKLTSVRLPPNFNKSAYLNNLNYVKKICKCEGVQLSLKTLRPFDYNYFNLFQKRFFAFTVIKSMQLMLRVRNKSLKNCCIVVCDVSDMINYNIIVELAKRSKYIVFLSWDLVKARKLADYIIANFGVSPIVTNDESYAIKIADFIVSSADYEFSPGKLVWLLDNSISQAKNNISVNDVSYNVPWNTFEVGFSMELIGAILCQMQEDDIEKALKYNGIYLKEIKFNNNVIC